jgi:hypothetical protein
MEVFLLKQEGFNFSLSLAISYRFLEAVSFPRLSQC